MELKSKAAKGNARGCRNPSAAKLDDADACAEEAVEEADEARLTEDGPAERLEPEPDVDVREESLIRWSNRAPSSTCLAIKLPSLSSSLKPPLIHAN